MIKYQYPIYYLQKSISELTDKINGKAGMAFPLIKLLIIISL